MINLFGQTIAKLGLTCALALGCTVAATTVTLLKENVEPTPAYADRWYQDPQDIISWYYLDNNGVPKTGWQKIGSSWYYFYSNGAMANGWVPIGAKYYYFGKGSGIMQTGWIKDPTRTWYYLGSDGAMKTGWQWISGKWYYFDGGAMVTGWQSIGGKWYHFNDSGAMQIGWIKSNYNIWYYCDKSGAMVTGWNKVGSTWYYHNKSGEMQIGWQNINGKWYHFAMSGAMSANTWVGNYYCKADGSMATNQKIGNYYVGPDGLWDGANKESQALHIATNAYEFDIPSEWKDKVSWSTSGNQTTVSLVDNYGNNLGLLFSVNVSTTYYGGGSNMSPVIYRQHYASSSNTDPSKYKVLEVTLYNSIATVDALSNYDVEKMSALIEFQTGGAFTLDQHLKNPTKYTAEVVTNYMSSKILPSIVLKN